MRKFGVLALIVALCAGLQASWYWPVGSDGVDEKPKRVSELIEPASLLIEEASDLAAENKAGEAIEKYRKALSELDRIEMENPERAKGVEFATVRNKRAYVNAAIDSLLLNQVRANAKVVAATDTTELERRLDRERWGKRLDRARKSIDRRESGKALDELEKARAGTTNGVQIAVTYGVIAGVCCQKGAFGEACRYLELQLKELVRLGVQEKTNTLTREERTLVSESLGIVRSRVVEGYEKTLDDGRQVCRDCARLGTLADLTATNAVALASNVVVRLNALLAHSDVFAFSEAANLRRQAAGLRLRTEALCRQMQAAEGDGTAATSLVWRVDLADLKSALGDFGGSAPQIREVDRHLEAALLLVDRKATAKAKKGEEPASAPPPTRREQTLIALSKGDYAAAKRLIDEMLAEKPNGAAALNLKAAMEARQGMFKEAEATLDLAIKTNPRNYFAYYNMANLMRQTRPDNKFIARYYYEAGREFGGPVDARLEEVLK